MIQAIALRRSLEELAHITKSDLETVDIVLKTTSDFTLAQLAIVLAEINKRVNQEELTRARKGLTR